MGDPNMLAKPETRIGVRSSRCFIIVENHNAGCLLTCGYAGRHKVALLVVGSERLQAVRRQALEQRQLTLLRHDAYNV
jgi:hypothetical protein